MVLVLVLALQPAEDGVEGVERCARGGAGGGDVHRKSAGGKERLVKGKEKEERRASKETGGILSLHACRFYSPAADRACMK